MTINFDNKNVLVIGGSSGIGRGIADTVSYTHLTLPTTCCV